jgi:hypothetical protein
MRTIRPILFLTILGIVLSACAGSAAQMAPIANGSSTDSTAGGGATRDLSGSDPGAVPIVGETGGNVVVAAVDSARIIRTGSMDLEVSDVPAAVKAARSAILAMGGYVGASNAGTNGDTPYAEISYRIPADRWEDALAELRVLGGLTTKIVSEQTQAVEVTAQVVDLEARIRNLQASETALQGIAARATKVSDILEIQAQLTSVRGEIEQLTAQLKDLNDRASYATLSARYSVPIVAVEAAAKGWSPGTAVDEASASLISTIQKLTDAGIWFVIVWLPILVVFGIVAGIGFVIARRMGLGRRGAMPPTLPPAPPAELPAAG